MSSRTSVIVSERFELRKLGQLVEQVMQLIVIEPSQLAGCGTCLMGCGTGLMAAARA